MFFKKLYLRIWLAVVLMVAVLTLLLGWAWRLATEPPLRDVVVRNEAGAIIGLGHARGAHTHMGPGSAASEGVPLTESEDVERSEDADPPARPTGGPRFLVRMADGKTMLLHLPRPPPLVWNRPPFGFFWTLALVAVAVALATYPIIRTLTRRLERLQAGVEQWGRGDLSTRLLVSGQDEIAFLAQRFNDAATRIQGLISAQEALLTSQKSLLANASHELRSPLTRIRMGLELMQGPATPEFRHEVARNISELDSLIEEILLTSRLDAQEADLGTIETVDLVGLAAEECARVGAELEVGSRPAGAPPRADQTLAVQGVAKLLRRLLRNLLENARHHAAGIITVQAEQRGTQVVLRVRDRGPGVPAALRARIFEPFFRLPGASERDGGVGLGLALVKAIALRHHGQVHCEDHAGGGACFVVTLPLSPATPARPGIDT